MASPSRSRRDGQAELTASRSRHASFDDIDDQSSPNTSPEAEAVPAAKLPSPRALVEVEAVPAPKRPAARGLVEVQAVPASKRPAPRGLVDALSRYFTPSDKRRSRVSLNALPLSSPRRSVSHPRRDGQAELSLTSKPLAADTTQSEDGGTLPAKRRHRKKSSSLFARPSLWKLSGTKTTADLASETMTHGLHVTNKSDNGRLRISPESPTSELSPGTCLPSESRPDVECSPACRRESSGVNGVTESFVAACVPSESEPAVEGYPALPVVSEVGKTDRCDTAGPEPRAAEAILRYPARPEESQLAKGERSDPRAAENILGYPALSVVSEVGKTEKLEPRAAENMAGYPARSMVSEVGPCDRSDTVGPSEHTLGSAETGKSSAGDSSQARKRRRTQLSSLHDSLSHFFTADGERKRTPVQYVDASEFAFDAYPPEFDHHRGGKRGKWKKSLHQLEPSHRAGDRVETMDTSSLSSLAAAAAAAAASWPSTSYRLSTYHLAGLRPVSQTLS